MKVMTIFGTRPEAVKLSPVVKVLEKYHENVESIVCVTAQHREMLDQVLDAFQIKPDFDLQVMEPGQSLGGVTTRVLTRLEALLISEKPDLVLVQGDTTTTFVAGLAAFYQRVRVGHVEAGLRTFDKYQPFPEEMNRKLATALADYHFAPTQTARGNLLAEGVSDDDITVTGNTGIDALLMVLKQIRESDSQSALQRFAPDAAGHRIVLVTAHRRESFGQGFESICNALLQIVEGYPDVYIVYPVHLNPNVQDPVNRLLKGHARIKLIAPLDYVPFVEFLDAAHLILTDSGGIQEEAPSLGKPVLVLRNVTERMEAVDAGTARLVGTTQENIVTATQSLLDDPAEYQKMSAAENPFGDGQASERIAARITADIT